MNILDRDLSTPETFDTLKGGLVCCALGAALWLIGAACFAVLR